MFFVAKYTLRQRDVTANLCQLSYEPAEGFEENNTWHVAEEFLSAESDTELTDGAATIQYAGKEFPVTVTVLERGKSDEEPDGDESVCSIEIGFAAGVSQLAMNLDLL